MTERSIDDPGSRPGGDGDRDPRLGLFALGGGLDRAAPSGGLLALLVSLESHGPGGAAFAGSTHDEDAGMLAAAEAAEAHAAWLKLALVGQLIRRHAPAVPGGMLPDPESWDVGLLHEIAAVLRISWQSAYPVAEMAWHLGARLPGVSDLLKTGVLSSFKAKIVCEEFAVLDAGQAAQAERLLLDHDLGADDMTPMAVRRLCQRIACTVDPGGAARRREEKARREASLRFFRDPSGTATMLGTGLAADDALAGESHVQQRALEYKAAGIAERMDWLRAQAGMDLINGVTVERRHAEWLAGQRDGDPPATEGTRDGNDEDPRDDGPGTPGQDGPEGGSGPGKGDGDGDPGPAPVGTPEPGLPSLVNMTLPLATVLGQARRPGEVPGFGAIDFALVRRLAAAAAASRHSGFCLTFTDADGHAAAHGCAKLIRAKRGTGKRGTGRQGKGSGPPGGARDGPADDGWDFEFDTARPGPEGGYGAWILTLPGGRRYRVDMHAIPLHSCDHRYATSAYRPSVLLRHLVEIRDGECTFTCCSHSARRSDFEHATPYDRGGATDACNGGMRSRRCHRVKQSPGWTVTQPKPGWHRWTMPSGRSYTKRPKRYPA